ncbi:MAG: hypothetical protein U5M23_05430 [Marinagarivorans sp.]|nr:hypothetical protein [Marinagarivorans sp.]
MKKLKKYIKYSVIFITGLVVLIGVVELFFDYFDDSSSSIDACLDLSGSWDYTLKKCQYK